MVRFTGFKHHPIEKEEANLNPVASCSPPPDDFSPDDFLPARSGKIPTDVLDTPLSFPSLFPALPDFSTPPRPFLRLFYRGPETS